jgi:hypothetical protein
MNRAGMSAIVARHEPSDTLARVGAVAAGAIFLVAFFLVGAIPLLPLLLRPLTRHSNVNVRGVAKVLVMALLWLGFDVSLMTIWGAVRFEPEWWQVLIGVPLLQIPAAWLSIHIAFGDDEPPARR